MRWPGVRFAQYHVYGFAVVSSQNSVKRIIIQTVTLLYISVITSHSTIQANHPYLNTKNSQYIQASHMILKSVGDWLLIHFYTK
jgi:hypothetical protein